TLMMGRSRTSRDLVVDSSSSRARIETRQQQHSLLLAGPCYQGARNMRPLRLPPSKRYSQIEVDAFWCFAASGYTRDRLNHAPLCVRPVLCVYRVTEPMYTDHHWASFPHLYLLERSLAPTRSPRCRSHAEVRCQTVLAGRWHNLP